ncbi:serine hydrolase [Streptomyces sp. Ncost-T10-10d]|uniref:serine hydrolase domain-containing protein n=1 Tax=Streptomyces sp. Ncost-T10-10d TaxID=1839774 RepID=UPI00081E6001|nr:serine hydrolase domain-containing protein [Streptomyces sp. Ncost-T10-10d]SCF65621.1 D-alanyl-D-alanine carboxypeptidase [Streptomyces sp. Ncost-T10-10d]
MSMLEEFGTGGAAAPATPDAPGVAGRPSSTRGCRRWLLPVATAACLLMTGVGPATAAAPATGSSAAEAQTPADILQAGAQQGIADGYPGVIGMVRKGDTTQYVHAGVGNRATKVPADPKATFRIGSNTKAFISTVLLQLEGEKRLSLDDTVARWLPGAVAANGYDGSKITIRQLLNHTSGLPDYLGALQISGPYFLNTNPREALPPQTLVDIGLGLRAPTSAPGEKFGYSNTNYVLVGMVIKAVTGSEPAAEVQRRIIEPLGLRDTSFPTADPALYGNYLHGYVLRAILIDDATVSNVQVSGNAGAIVSTMDDLATFTRALLTGELLEPAQMAELKTTVPVTADAGYGLGIEHVKLSCGKWAWGHNGAVLGYFSEWMTSEDGTEQVLHANNEFHMLAGTPGQTHTGTAMSDAFCAL